MSQVGSQIEVAMSCSGISPAATGVFGVDVLATASGDETTRLGVNLTAATLDSPPYAFVDTALTTGGAASYRSLGEKNATEYHNPGTNTVPFWELHSGGSVNITVLVDGGMSEAFFGEQLPITTLVQPSLNATGPNARYARPFNTAKGVTCEWWISKLTSLF